MTTTAPGTVVRPLRARYPRSVIGIPMATLTAVELLALGGFLLVPKQAVLVPVGTAIAAAVLLWRRRTPIWTLTLLPLAFLLRRRNTRVPWCRAGGNGHEQASVPAELEAFFPGIALRNGQTHDGERVGVVQWGGTCTATLRIRPAGGIVCSRASLAAASPDAVPLDVIFAALDWPDLGVDTVQTLTQTIVGAPDPACPTSLAAANAELAGGRPRVRNRTTFVTVRVDPSTAMAAIAGRGGGRIGIDRVLCAALGRIRSAARELGLTVELLDADAVACSIAASCYHEATAYDPVVTWTESVHDIASARMAHRTFVLTELPRLALADIRVSNVFAYALSIQAKALPGGGWSTTSLLRLTCRSVDSLDQAERELYTAAARTGISLRSLDTMQQLGLRATFPLGGS